MHAQTPPTRRKNGIFFTDHGILVGIRHRIAPKLSEMEAPCLIYPKSFHLFRIFRCGTFGDFFKKVSMAQEVQGFFFNLYTHDFE
ncbi:MAG: hypothetical protein GY821_09100 [Gammaproteobacteria bacterium]|nr:hypothetical protein [Gammaproteobacteria bacterium]